MVALLPLLTLLVSQSSFANIRETVGMQRLAVGKLSEFVIGGTLWCRPGSSVFLVVGRRRQIIELSRLQAVLRSKARKSSSRSVRRQLRSALRMSGECSRKTQLTPTTTPTTAPTLTPTSSPPLFEQLPGPVETPTATPGPTSTTTVPRCRSNAFLWDVGGTVDQAEYGLTRYPHISQDRVVMLNTSWNGALPDIVDDSPSQRSRLAWLDIPIVSAGDTLIVNGGTPLRGDHALHLQKLQRHIEMNVPDRNFDGYVILDFERWWPQWELSSAYWQEIARSQTAADNPGLDEEALTALTKQLWETQAIQFYRETVEKIKEMRPNAKVGWYGLMDRPYWNGYSSGNGDNLRAINNKSLPIVAAMDVVVASIYQFYSSAQDENGLPLPVGEGMPPDSAQWFENNRQYVEDNINEAQRLAAQAGGKEVMAYAWPRYHNSGSEADRYHLVRTSDLFIQLIYPLLLGADSVAIWGFEHLGLRYSTLGWLPDYVQSQLGPMVENYCTRNDQPLAGLYSAVSRSPVM